jgi:single-strand DNA-binding protein
MPLPLITISGNLTQDPELRFTKTEKAVATLRVACSDRKRTESGEWVDGETIYLNVVVWNQTATNAAQSLNKGDSIVVQGKLKQRDYVDKEGQTKTIFEVEADYLGAELRRFSYQKQSDNVSWNPAPASGSTDNTIWGKSF